MPVTTYVDRARERVRAEREAVEAKRAAVGSFIDRVAGIEPETPQAAASGITATGGSQGYVGSAGEDRCRLVRRAFAETVRPHSVDDIDDAEPLLETVRAELTDTVAVALAPTTGASFGPELKRMVLAEAESRRAETAVLRQALEREAEQLEEAGTVVDRVTSWVAEADEVPLTELGFDTLAARHGALATHRDRCEQLARRRQAFLRETTSEAPSGGVRHRSLIPYLYDDFPVDHPVLATVARLGEVCESCQRAVRTHLSWRG